MPTIPYHGTRGRTCGRLRGDPWTLRVVFLLLKSVFSRTSTISNRPLLSYHPSFYTKSNRTITVDERIFVFSLFIEPSLLDIAFSRGEEPRLLRRNRFVLWTCHSPPKNASNPGSLAQYHTYHTTRAIRTVKQ